MKGKVLAVIMTLMLAGIMSVGCSGQQNKGESTEQIETSKTGEKSIPEQNEKYKEDVVAYPEGQVFCIGKSAPFYFYVYDE